MMRSVISDMEFAQIRNSDKKGVEGFPICRIQSFGHLQYDTKKGVNCG